jgi:hypothetical protein
MNNDDVLWVMGWLGDSRLLLPLSLGLALTLYREQSAGAAWMLALAVGLVGIALAKIVGYATNLGSPSGHTFFAALFYGTLGVLAVRTLDGWRGFLAGAAAAGAILVVAVNRFATSAHTPGEIAFGLTLGLACTVLFVRRPAVPGLPVGACWGILVLMVIAMLTLEVMEASTEEVFHAAGKALAERLGL